MRGAVWGSTFEVARQKLQQIVEDYKRIGIRTIRYVNCSSATFAEFENGDIWKALRASDSSRGSKINVSYIDYNISEEVINTIIKPSTIAYPFQAIHYYWTERVE